jgi:hypothetical protein
MLFAIFGDALDELRLLVFLSISGLDLNLWALSCGWLDGVLNFL